MPSKVRLPTLHIVEADREFASRISGLLRSTDLEVQTNHSAADFLDSFELEHTAGVLIDAELPEMAGAGLVRLLRERGLAAPIVVMASASTDASVAGSALAAGATGFVQKPLSGGALVGMTSAVRVAMLGGLEPAVQPPLPALSPIGALRERFSRLTARERQVAELAAQGLSSKEIAHSLDLSKSTVDNHRAHVLEKLQLGNFVQVARFLSTIAADR